MTTNYDDAWNSRREKNGQLEEESQLEDTCGREHGNYRRHPGIDHGNLLVELADVVVKILNLLPVRLFSRLGPVREAANECGEAIFELYKPFLHVSRGFADTFRFL